MSMLNNFIKQDMKLALNSLLKLPGFSITAIATLAFTLAALAVVLNINYLVLTKPLPYPNADALIVTDQSETINGETQYGFQMLSAQFHLYNDRQFIDRMAIIELAGGRIVDLKDKPFVDGLRVTPEYFSLLNTPMHLGRYFNADEGINDRQTVMVLSYHSWQQHFGSDPGIIGHYTQIDQTRYQIIGVSAAHFEPPEIFGSSRVDAFFSFPDEISTVSHWANITSGVNGLARLKPGVSIAQANLVLGKQLNELYQGRPNVVANTSIGASFTGLKQKIVSDSTEMALLLLAGVLTLLVIAISNLTNLFLSRAAQKHRVMAIQAALGAKPKHLFAGLFAEALLICAIACIMGLLLAAWIMVWLETDLQSLFTRLQTLSLDKVTVLASISISLGIAIVMAWLCSKQVHYATLNSQLQASGKGCSAQISTLTRNLLIASQIGFATLLLFGATSVLSPTLERLNKVVGFNTDQVYDLAVDTADIDVSELRQLTGHIKQALKAQPQVKDVARSTSPLNMGWEIYLYDAQNTLLGIVSTGYFDTNSFELLQHELVDGNTFSPFEGEQVPPAEIIISESLAKRLFNGQSAIGQTLQTALDTPLTVVGVVKDIYVPDMRPSYAVERFYLPYRSQRLWFSVKLNSELSRNDINNLLKTIHPSLSVSQYISLNERLAQRLQRTKLTALLTISLIMLALTLAAAGVYGVLSYSVQMRRYELGIHLSLGAHTHRVIAMVIKQSMQPVIIGILAGTGTAALSFLMMEKFWRISFNAEIQSVLMTIPVILTIAFIACYLPVRKVVAEDPLKALRSE